MKKTKILIGCTAIFFLLFAGIIRDDVNEGKYLKLGAQKQFECVGQIFKNGKSSGSAVLIGKRHVLTAAHCLYTYITKPDTMLMNKQTVIFYKVAEAMVTPSKELLFKFGNQVYGVKAIRIYNEYDWKKGGLDLALVELEEDVTNIEPAILNKNHDELGYNVVGVGLGTSGKSMQFDKLISASLKIAGENVIDSLGGKLVNNLPSLLICDFDSPTDPTRSQIGSAIPRPLEYICSGGDSGGGMFRFKKGKWELVGICASADAGVDTLLKHGYYGLTMSWTRVSVFYNWIKENI